MLKRLLSLVFAFVLVFNIGFNNLTFADDDDAFASQGIPYSGGQKTNVDQCKDASGVIDDVECAVAMAIEDMKQFHSNQKSLSEFGPNKEYAIHLWTYNVIHTFAYKMKSLMQNSVQSLLESGTLANALNTSTEGIKNFFNLSSKEQIEKILNRWLIKSKYTDKPEDLDKIISNVLCDLNGVNAMSMTKEIGGEQKGESLGQGAGAVGGGGLGAFLGGAAAKTLAVKMAAAAVAGGPAVVLVGGLAGAATLGYAGYHTLGYAGRKIGGYFGQKTAEEEIYQKAQEKTSEYNKYNVWADVYASTIEQVFDQINRSYWQGNDLLLAKLNFDPVYKEAYTEFRKEGFPYNPKDAKKNFNYLEKELGNLLSKYNISSARKDL